jgi:glycerophosphoryl diester phosphodiesterase
MPEPDWTPQRPSVVAHRGASKAARENTLEAFRLARELGATMVELDVRRTADDVLIVHHDPLIDGVAIITMTAAHLPADVPGLATALDACVGMEVNIEIKNDDTEPDYDPTYRVASKVVDLLRERGDGARMLISSFDRATINAVHRTEPALRTGYLFMAPELPLDEFMHSLQEEGHVAIHPYRRAVTQELCNAAHAAGLAVNVWTVDAPDEMRTLAGLGADAVITNVPDVAVATLR